MVDRVRFGRRAVAAHARAVELDPANAAAHVGLGIAKLETPALLGGSADAALRFFRRARELEPGLARAWIWEGIALRRAGQSAEARDALRRALTLEPHNGQAQAELSSLDSDASK